MALDFESERRQFANLLNHIRSGQLVILYGSPGDGKETTAGAALRALNQTPVVLDIARDGEDLIPIPVLNETGDNYQMIPARRLLQVIRGERPLVLPSLEQANAAQMAVVQELIPRTPVVGTWTTHYTRAVYASDGSYSGSTSSAGEEATVLAFAAKYNAIPFDQDKFMINPAFRGAYIRYDGDLDKLLSTFVPDQGTGDDIPQGGGIQAALAIADAEVKTREL